MTTIYEPRRPKYVLELRYDDGWGPLSVHDTLEAARKTCDTKALFHPRSEYRVVDSSRE